MSWYTFFVEICAFSLKFAAPAVPTLPVLPKGCIVHIPVLVLLAHWWSYPYVDASLTWKEKAHHIPYSSTHTRT